MQPTVLIKIPKRCIEKPDKISLTASKREFMNKDSSIKEVDLICED
jgi:hypothetical protein